MTASGPRRYIMLAIVVCVVLYHTLSSPLRAPSAPRETLSRSPAVKFDPGRVVVWEEGIHDEVTGAIGYSLDRAGVQVVYNCWFRHDFASVLSTFLSYRPEIITPHGDDAPLKKWLEEGQVDNIILNTCAYALPKLAPMLLDSSVHVTCVVHHAGAYFESQLKTLLLPFVKQRRASVIVLGEHVRRTQLLDVEEWAEREGNGWDEMPVGVLIPAFDYPAEAVIRRAPHIYPSRVVLQGNIEQGRRDYKKMFNDLLLAMTAHPERWGYEIIEGVFKPDESAEPFQLFLLGSINKDSLVPIPDALQHVVKVKSGLTYPEFYHFIASSDMLVPAFAQRSTYESTTSSSIATALSNRTPILVSPRHLRAYTYVRGPLAVAARNMSQSEVCAIEGLRMTRQIPIGADRSQRSGWSLLHQEIAGENGEMWKKVLKQKISVAA